ncbi:MAG TPA: hypothetical protein VNG35_12190 [Gemmatimonadales bacterium]|nr:hypothetical protein [Gemmatimonadales bacterium]
MPYNSKQQAVDALRPGYKVVGEAPYVVKVANPKAGLAGEPSQIDQQAGIILSIQGPGGEPDSLIVKEVGNNPNTKGGVGFDVIQGPQGKPATTSTPAAGLERLDAKGNPIPAGSNTPAVYLRDPKAPPGTQPFKVEGDLTTDPSQWTPIADPNDPSGKRIIGLWDPVNNKIGASVQSAAGNKASDPSKWNPVYRSPGDASSGVVGQWDPVNNELHAVSTTADGRQIVTTPTAIYSFNKDEPDPKKQLVKLTDVTKDSPFQIVTYPDGSMYRFDPNETDASKALVAVGPNGPPKTLTSNGITYLYDADSGTYKLPPGVSKAATANNSTTLKNLEWYDDQGNLIASHPNTNYQPPAVQVPAPNANARLIAIPDPDNPSKLKWVPNEGRITASDALKQLATSLTGTVVAGDISQDEAIQLINAANARMTNDINTQQNVTTAAGDVLANTRANAQTAGNLLQQRAQAATGTLQSILGQTLQNKNITSYPSDVGANLVQGLSGWTADLMGGQATLDSAARMVQMADPKSDNADPTTQAAIGTLRQMLDKYQQLTNTQHPIVAATQAASASQQQAATVAPQTAVARPVVPAVPAIPPAQAAGMVAPLAAVPGANYGAATAYTGGIYPWNAAPGASFIAPNAPVALASST